MTTVKLPTTKPSTPISLEGVETIATSGGVSYKVRKHSLGLCVGCDGHNARICDYVKCYDKEKPNQSYALERVGKRKYNTKPKTLGE